MDIIKISRIGGMLDDKNSHFRRLFTEKEQELGMKSQRELIFYAERFACKEAVFKCFGISMDTAFLKEIETLNDENGKPYVNLYGRMEQLAKDMGIRKMDISISYDGEYAVAYAAAS